MSVEFLDKSVSTEDVADGGTDFARLEAVLSVLVENKVVSMREVKRAEKRRLFGRFRTRSDESGSTDVHNRINSTSTISSSPRKIRQLPEVSVRPPLEFPSKSFDSEATAPAGRVQLQQSFDSYDASKHSDSCCCEPRVECKPDIRKSSCLPKHLSTQEWLNATSRQTSTETATTSSGYISPTSGAVSKKADMSEMDECTVVAACCREHCCVTPYLPSTCEASMQPLQRQQNPTEGHCVSCCNSPVPSEEGKLQYDENYIALAINLEDLEFEQEEERRKRRKRKKKRRKERLARSRGFMADELKDISKCRILDPDDLPKRARWTIVATACILLLMSMLLVGATLRMAPIIDDMVRKENDEIRNSLNRHDVRIDGNRSAIVFDGT